MLGLSISQHGMEQGRANSAMESMYLGTQVCGVQRGEGRRNLGARG